jgi:hypothetical protein
MITDKSKKRVIDLDDEDIDDARRSRVMPDGHTLRVPLMMMDSAPDPTGLTPVQKQALCDEINRGVPFDRALETARSTTTSNDVRLHQPGFRGDAAPQAVADARASYDKRSERLSSAWRDSETVNDRLPLIPKPAQEPSTISRDQVDRALDKRSARLANAYKS